METNDRNRYSCESTPSTGSSNANKGQSTENDVYFNYGMFQLKPSLSTFSQEACYSDETCLPW